MFDKIVAGFLSIITAILSAFYVPSQLTPLAEPHGKKTVSQQISVMSYNLRFSGEGDQSAEARAPLIKEDILRYKPDSFGAQECTDDWFKILDSALTDYAHVGVPRYLFFGEASPVYYMKNKYDAVKSGSFWISLTPDIPSRFPDAQFNRVCSYVVLRDKSTGFEYAHFNTHLDHRGKYARIEAAAIISKKISEICPDIPVVLTGDLNETPESEMYKRFIGCGFVDLREKAEIKENSAASTYHAYGTVDDEIIDYILTNPGFLIKARKYVTDLSVYNGVYPSDHHPVYASFDLQNYRTGE